MSNRISSASKQQTQAVSSRSSVQSIAAPEPIKAVLSDLLSHYPAPVSVDFWGQDFIGADSSSADLILRFRHPGVLRNLMLHQDRIFLTECWLNHYFDFEGSTRAMIDFADHMSEYTYPKRLALRAWIAALKLPKLSLEQVHSVPFSTLVPMAAKPKSLDAKYIQHHYDVGNDFYSLWLDRNLVYSCAHFERDDMTLDQAQEAKMDLICRKLMLKPGERLLDVGCGWGALIRWAARHYGVTAYGITLSQEQLEYCRQCSKEENLQDLVHVDLRDYRDMPSNASFDKIVSVGMIEHVGLRNYPAYFSKLLQVLKPNGLFLCHGITSRGGAQSKNFNSEFINKYIFPGGELAAIDEVIHAAREQGWEPVDVDGWRPHYARTLKCWAENLERNKQKAIEVAGESKVKLWRLYLTASARGFENNWLGIYQTLLRRQDDSKWTLPLTRKQWLC